MSRSGGQTQIETVVVRRPGWTVWASPENLRLVDDALKYEASGCSMNAGNHEFADGYPAVDLVREAQKQSGLPVAPAIDLSEVVNLIGSLSNATWNAILRRLGYGPPHYNTCLLIELPVVSWFDITALRLYNKVGLSADGREYNVAANFTPTEVSEALVDFLNSQIEGADVTNEIAEVVKRNVPGELGLTRNRDAIDVLIDPLQRRPKLYLELAEYWQELSLEDAQPENQGLISGWSARLELTNNGRLALRLFPIISDLVFLNSMSLEPLLTRAAGIRVQAHDPAAQVDRLVLSQVITRVIRFLSREFHVGDRVKIRYLDAASRRSAPADLDSLPELEITKSNWPTSTALEGYLLRPGSRTRDRLILLEYLPSPGKWVDSNSPRRKEDRPMVLLLPTFDQQLESLLGRLGGFSRGVEEAPSLPPLARSLPVVPPVVGLPPPPIQPQTEQSWYQRLFSGGTDPFDIPRPY